MKIKMIHIFRFLFCISLLFNLSCIDEPEYSKSQLPPAAEGFARIELFTNTSDFQKPATRIGIADETTVENTPWVIVFHGNDNNAVFYEAQQSRVINNRSYVDLTATTSAARLLIIANPPASFYNGTSNVAFDQLNLTTQLSGQTFAEAANNILLTILLDSPLQTSVPYTPNLTLPMSNILDVSKIDGSTTIGTSTDKLLLNRIVARVSVINEDANFNLQGAAILNAPRNGRLYETGSSPRSNAGNLTDYLTSSDGDGVTGIAPTDGTQNTNANPLYIYESVSADNTSVIIKGIFNGSAYFYKMAFAEDNVQLDILRNTLYEFTVSSITGPGYNSIADAKAAPPSNIHFTITVTDLGSHDIMDNGQYYLGVSNSELVEYAQSGIPVNNILALTVYTNAPSSINIRSIAANSSNGQLTVTTPAINVSGSVVSTDVYVDMGATFTDGTITLQLGNMTKIINVTRKPINAAGITEEFKPDYTSGVNSDNDWIRFSTDGVHLSNKVYRTTQGSIFLTVLPNSGREAGNTRSGFAYLSRLGDMGRVKIDVNQEFEQSASFGIDCSSTIVNGIYEAGRPLDVTNTITLTLNVTGNGVYEINSDIVDGISFSGSGEFTSSGTQTVTLYGHGTPVGTQIKTMTLTVNSDIPSACTIPVRMIIPSKRILSLGTNGWAIQSPTGIANMFNNPLNFGSDINSTFKTYKPTVVPATGTYIEGLITSTRLQPYLEPVSGNPVDIVIMTYNADLSGAAATTMMVNYVRNGGVLIMLNEHNVEQIANFNFIKQLFGNDPSIAGVDNVVVAGSVLRLPTNNDEILNGPFGDVRDKFVGEDGGYGDVFTFLPAAQLEWIVNSIDYSGTGGSASQIFAFKAKNYNFFWCGDGGLAASNGTTVFTNYPVTLTAAPNYKPSNRLYGRNAANRRIVDNATFMANIFAWGIEEAEFNGINK